MQAMLDVQGPATQPKEVKAQEGWQNALQAASTVQASKCKGNCLGTHRSWMMCWYSSLRTRFSRASFMLAAWSVTSAATFSGPPATSMNLMKSSWGGAGGTERASVRVPPWHVLLMGLLTEQGAGRVLLPYPLRKR